MYQRTTLNIKLYIDWHVGSLYRPHILDKHAAAAAYNDNTTTHYTN